MKSLVVLLLLLARAAVASESWTSSLARMPLAEPLTDLNRTNAVSVIIRSLQPDDTVKALIFMPGATDEFYFFKRAHATLPGPRPTLLDAVAALTNQTLIRATFRPPFLLLHTAEDPLVSDNQVEHEPTADRLRKKKITPHIVSNDRDWDSIYPDLSFELNVILLPRPPSIEANHFYRHSFAAHHLSAFEFLEALTLAGKSRFIVEKRRIVFHPDPRVLGSPPTEGISTFKP